MFQLKRFNIEDDISSMKVGTDAILLGAWAELPTEGRLIEIGCGCGVISLMAAQRQPSLHITGIDIHLPSVEQARENAARSPFHSVEFLHTDFLSYTCLPVKCILSNPPYHTESLQSPCASRAAARSEATLPFPELVRHSSELLVPGGYLQVIIPIGAYSRFHSECNNYGLSLTRITMVRTTPKKEPKRVLLTFRKGSVCITERSELTLLDSAGMRSKTYSDLCRDFYL